MVSRLRGCPASQRAGHEGRAPRSSAVSRDDPTNPSLTNQRIHNENHLSQRKPLSEERLRLRQAPARMTNTPALRRSSLHNRFRCTRRRTATVGLRGACKWQRLQPMPESARQCSLQKMVSLSAQKRSTAARNRASAGGEGSACQAHSYPIPEAVTGAF